MRGPSGSIDMSFGGGVVKGAVNAAFDTAIAQPDRKVLAVATAADGACRLARFDEDGTLEPAFGVNGIVTFVDCTATPHLLVDTSGRILFQGTSIVRLLADGKHDPSWAGDAGVLPSAGGGSADGRFAEIAAGPSNTFFAAYTCASAACTREIRLLRLTSEGTLDSTYNAPNGVRSIAQNPTGAAFSIGSRLVVAPDGRVGYAYRRVGGTDQPIAIAVVAPDGTLHTNSGDLNATTGPSSLAMNDGVDGGFILGFDSTPLGVVERIDSALARDPAYGSDGGSSVASFRGKVTTVHTRADGTVIAAGASEDRSSGVVMRLMPSGARDVTFGTGGLLTVDIAAADEVATVTGSFVQRDESVIIVGSLRPSAGGDAKSFVVRLWQ
ncbi:MAG: hypothetical protein KIT84_07025 [Labilithrix sp.]|nr:hypothetical protein [Labilithrix sp.]MCW5810747.1 hypothetical protein [Labilithrix sp.]